MDFSLCLLAVAVSIHFSPLWPLVSGLQEAMKRSQRDSCYILQPYVRYVRGDKITKITKIAKIIGLPVVLLMEVPFSRKHTMANPIMRCNWRSFLGASVSGGFVCA